jgi:hypothetical protein
LVRPGFAQGFTIPKQPPANQVLPSLSHAPSPFFLWLFWRWGLGICLPCLISNHNPPDLGLSGC